MYLDEELVCRQIERGEQSACEPPESAQKGGERLDAELAHPHEHRRTSAHQPPTDTPARLGAER